MEKIKKAVEFTFGLDLGAKNRRKNFVEARACYYKLCVDITASSITAIAKSVSKNHATILHALKEFPYMCVANKDLKTKYNFLKKELLDIDTKPNTLEDLLLQFNRLQLRLSKLKAENETLKGHIENLKKQIK